MIVPHELQEEAGRAHVTGQFLPSYDDDADAREIAAVRAYRTVGVAYPPQKAIMSRIETLRRGFLGVRGVPLPGLRLSQVSQAGKSWTLHRYIALRKAEALAGEAAINPHQIIYVGLRKRVTVKMLYQRILAELKDPHSTTANLELLTQRAEELMLEHGVELLIIDEVQHLANKSKDNAAVTDELKSFLDRGIVPVVLAGNEHSLAFFEENNQLAARLGAPLELSPINGRELSGAVMFKTFCVELDEALMAAGAIRRLSDFGASSTVRALLRASGGHIGRVCRIVEEALKHAARRDADFIERYDLAYAVRYLAMPAQWIGENPFPEPEHW